VLIDEHGDAAAGLQRPHHPADHSLPVDHRVSGPLPNLLEEGVEIRIVERTRDHAEWFECQRVDQRMQLPEPNAW
jgi:hypothetical protein